MWGWSKIILRAATVECVGVCLGCAMNEGRQLVRFWMLLGPTAAGVLSGQGHPRPRSPSAHAPAARRDGRIGASRDLSRCPPVSLWGTLTPPCGPQPWCPPPPPPLLGGVFAQRGHSANYYGDYPGNNPENHPPAESCTINSKLKNSNI